MLAELFARFVSIVPKIRARPPSVANIGFSGQWGMRGSGRASRYYVAQLAPGCHYSRAHAHGAVTRNAQQAVRAWDACSMAVSANEKDIWQGAHRRAHVSKGKRDMGVKAGPALLVRWTIAFAAVVGICVVCVLYLDRPVAALAAAHFGFPRPALLGYPWLTSASMIAVLVIAERSAEGRGLSRLSRALVLSGFALAWGVCTAELLLKPLFGRLPPLEWFTHGAYAFQWFSHADEASFPSGHAVQMAAVATVFWSAFPGWRWVYGSATLVLSVALIAGNWHYVSDVIAGLFVGLTAGMIVQALWSGIGKSTETNLAE